MRAYGAGEAQIQAVLDAASARQNQVRYTVWPENWRAWEVFRRAQGQWRRDGLGAPIAVDAGVVLRLIELTDPGGRRARLRLFDAVSLIERGALLGWKELRVRNPPKARRR